MTATSPELAVPEEARADADSLREIVVCSLEPWDEVWRRNQFLVDGLLKRNSELRVLFVEPPADPLFDLASRRVPALPRTRRITADGRLRAFRPLKPFPRKLGAVADAALLEQVRLAARAMRFSRPVLWINDVTYAPLIARTGWPSVYDVTDDWLLAPFSDVEIERLTRLDEEALRRADGVVVCSPALQAARGRTRDVSLIPNAVDVEHFRRPRPRPADLPDGPVAVYVGTLHESRLDVDLVVETARAIAPAHVVLVGPSSLQVRSEQVLEEADVVRIGTRPYADVPGYLQHATVTIVPHQVSPFTESLDPIKAHECLALDTPTVATAVPGFRERDDVFVVATRDGFAASVAAAMTRPSPRPLSHAVGWDVRVRDFESVLRGATQVGARR